MRAKFVVPAVIIAFIAARYIYRRRRRSWMERVGDKVRWRAKRLGDFMTGKVVFALKSFNQMDMRGMREFAREAAIMRERIRDLGKEFRRYDGEIKGEDDEGVPESTEPEKRERKRRHIVTEPDNEQS